MKKEKLDKIIDAIADLARELLSEVFEIENNGDDIVVGSPRKMTAKEIEQAKKLMADHSNSVADVCRMLRISRSTLYRNLNGQADR